MKGICKKMDGTPYKEDGRQCYTFFQFGLLEKYGGEKRASYVIGWNYEFNTMPSLRNILQRSLR